MGSSRDGTLSEAGGEAIAPWPAEGTVLSECDCDCGSEPAFGLGPHFPEPIATGEETAGRALVRDGTIAPSGLPSWRAPADGFVTPVSELFFSLAVTPLEALWLDAIAGCWADASVNIAKKLDAPAGTVAGDGGAEL